MTTIDLDELTSRAHSADADGRFVSVEPDTMLALIALARQADEASRWRDSARGYQIAYEAAVAEIAARDEALKVAKEALEPLKLLADDVDREFDGFVTPRPGYRVAVSFGDCLKARVALAALSSLLAPARFDKSDTERELLSALRNLVPRFESACRHAGNEQDAINAATQEARDAIARAEATTSISQARTGKSDAEIRERIARKRAAFDHATKADDDFAARGFTAAIAALEWVLSQKERS